MNSKHLLEIAVEAAHACAKIQLKHFRKTLRISEKPGAGLVTNADVDSEKAALKILKKATPKMGVLTEESGVHAGVDRWIMDPLDGTTNYVHGFPMFCVSIAAEIQGELVAGVIYHPVLKDLYCAIRGKGATLNGKKISVSKTKRLEDALLTTGFTYRKTELLHQEMEAFERLSGVARAVRRPGSAALDLAYTACGVFDGFWERRLSPWDIAAGGLIVQEAGGRVTDYKGRPFQVADSQILASNDHLHQALMHTIDPPVCPI